MKRHAMKRLLLPTLGLLTSLLTAQAQFFTNGNLAVVRLSGYDTTSSTGAAVIIDQYTTNGTLVNSFGVPTSGPKSLILNGQGYEGLLNITPDGGRLVFAGYNTPLPYVSNIISSESILVPRVVATLDGYGVYSLVVTNTTNFNDSAISSAASDGTNFWMAGTGPSPSASIPPGYNEVAYVGTAIGGATNLVPPVNLFTTSCREVTLYNVAGTNELFAIGSASNSAFGAFRSGAFLLSNISGSLPTNVTAATNLFPGHFLLDIAINPSGTVAYGADNDDGIIKYTNGPSGWVSNYTVSLTNAQGPNTGAFQQSATSVAVDWSQSPPVVYATTGETITNRLVVFQDTNSGGTNIVTTLAKGSTGSITNTYRGVRFAPVSLYAYISASPMAFTGAPGETATFSATVLGAPTVTYQWYSNSPANLTYMAIPGATSSNLSVANINTSQSGSMFYLVASNAYGSSQSAPATLTVLNPAIITEPMGETNFPGGNPVTLCVSAVGTGTLTYQWLSNGVPISGAQSSCYTVSSSVVSNSALYSVIVSNSLNESVTSSVTTVAYTPYLLYDTFTYPNGILFGDAGSPWTEESGSNPIYVTNDFAQISQTIGALGTAFGQSLYTQPQAEGSTVLWASFNINLKTLPATPTGTYFAYFQSTNFNFYGRVIALTSNNPAYTPDISPVAYPGTYRIGIANDATAASAVVELDMAPGIDYNVVAYYDMVNQFCQVSVNPSQTNYDEVTYINGATTPNSLTSGLTADAFSPTTLPMAAYGLRQAANVGVLDINDLEVSYDWNGLGSGFVAVTAGAVPTIPVIGFLSPGVTNYSGNSNILEVAASGIGLSYTWFQNGVQLTDETNVAGVDTPTLTLSYLDGTNSGNYTVVVSNSAGSVTSAVVVVSVNTTPTAPVFTLQPVSVTNSLGANVTFTASAFGTGPITYQWNTDGTPNGATGSSYTLTRITTNLSGNTYSVTATGGTGLATTSSNATLTVLGPVVTNIAFLRSLQVTNAAPTITIPASNSTTVYQVTATVMEYTNIESATYAEYWIQDSTAGIEFFVTDPTFRPHLGDLVTVSGVVDIFDDAVELDGSANNPSEPYSITSTNSEGLPLPYPAELIPFGFATANPGLSSLVYQGKLGIFTNCYFTTPGTNIAGEATLTVTNLAGQSYELFISQSAGPDLIGQPIPTFAYSITGEYDQFDANYELNLSAGFNIVTAPPPPVSNVVASLTGTNLTLTWPVAVSPNTSSSGYTYSIWSTTNLLIPFSPLAPGLWFGTSNGTFTIPVSTNTPAMFFQINSP